ncbi:MAG: hypothetical protein WC782_13250 [Methylococcaceae bacterium]|jgi:hypothetical protein
MTASTNNPWGIRFMTMFHMSNDSHLFQDSPSPGRLPLYEAKMIHQFDHRWATYSVADGKDMTGDVALADKQNPDFYVTPRYWLDKAEVDQRLRDKSWERGWLLGFRDITNATNKRTVIAGVLPKAGVGHTMPLLTINSTPKKIAALLGNLDSIVLDFMARQKVGGTHLAYSYLKQFPVLPPDFYTDSDLDFIVPRVLELTYTAHDLQSWAQDLGYDGLPFSFDPTRLAILRAELDAWYARAYGLTRDELRYILDPADVMGDDYPSETFRVLKNNELREFGEYRTGRLVLQAFDRMALADAEKKPFESQLVPPPGQKNPVAYSPLGIIRDDVDARLAGLMLSMFKESSSLPRKQLDLALTVAQMSDSASSQLANEVTDMLDKYRNLSVFDTERVGRSQILLRYFENTGVIRFEQKGAWITTVPTAPIPDGIILGQEMKEIALALLSVAQTKLQQPSSLAEDGDEDSPVKRA